MKRTLLLSTLLLSIFISCKKSKSAPSSPDYHLTATIDGKAQTFNWGSSATMLTRQVTSTILLGGLTDSTASTQINITWSVQSLTDVTFTTGIWSDTAIIKYQLAAEYMTSQIDQYMAGAQLASAAAQAGAPLKDHFQLVITYLDSASIKGTFSGDFYYHGDISGAKKTLTNGDFYLPLKKI